MIKEMRFRALSQSGVYRIDGYNPVLVSSGFGFRFSTGAGVAEAFYGFQLLGRVNTVSVFPSERSTLGALAPERFHIFLVGTTASDFPKCPELRALQGSDIYAASLLNAANVTRNLSNEMPSFVRIVVSVPKVGSETAIIARRAWGVTHFESWLDLSVAGNEVAIPERGGESSFYELLFATSVFAAPAAQVRVIGSF